MNEPESTYLRYLPAVMRGDFLGRFLLAFEAILSNGELGKASPEEQALPALEQLLDQVHTFFDPALAPESFLPWLSQWVATSLREDWPPERKRQFLGKIVQLYQMRGTLEGITEVLRLSGEDATVVEFDNPLQSKEAQEFGPEPKPPHLFGVILVVSEQDPALLARKVRDVCAIVDREKPAHTFYALLIKYPAMRINNDPKARPDAGPGIIVNRNTVLGTLLVPGTKKP
jgi:phage tail-like protein